MFNFLAIDAESLDTSLVLDGLVSIVDLIS